MNLKDRPILRAKMSEAKHQRGREIVSWTLDSESDLVKREERLFPGSGSDGWGITTEGDVLEGIFKKRFTVLVTTKYIYVYKLQNTNCVNGAMSSYKLNALWLHSKLVLWNIEMKGNTHSRHVQYATPRENTEERETT